jgi:adenosylhomocysteine nucleosidase
MHAVIILSATQEWKVALSFFPKIVEQTSPLGQWFEIKLAAVERDTNGAITNTGLLRKLGYPVIFFHGGWGKVAAAAATQYVIDRWHPPLLINLGTCGGFEGHIERDEIILAEKTIIYDIMDQMSDPEESIQHYATAIDLSWIKGELPQPVRRTWLVSGDRDLVADELPTLHQRFGAVAGDWESGAIAWVAARNRTRTLILRGVSDLVGPGGGEAYDGNRHVFVEGTTRVMQSLLEHVSEWVALNPLK